MNTPIAQKSIRPDLHSLIVAWSFSATMFVLRNGAVALESLGAMTRRLIVGDPADEPVPGSVPERAAA